MRNIEETLLSAIDKGKTLYGSAAELARVSGVKPANISRWSNRKQSPRLEDYAPILEAVNTQVAYGEEKFIDFDFIPKVAARAGAGSSLETSSETVGLYAFRKDYITAQGIHSKSSILLDVIGDSMEPLLRDGDTILVDTLDKEVRDGKTYLVAYGDDLKVKHVFKTPRGLILRSENTRYADVLIEPEELGTFAIIHGRVRWFGRMM